ncbi:hypothetical protein SAMN05216488_0221 [Microbacterium sp. LKL04]|uniref:hypothetical protein n=1 Tax=Microbacterium sp. LKL04 TaxID=912630 RepID=UPI000875AB79|nr:hypothetical protein [Microbacterium sp. LKL04]SCX98534.1 hypothetical protein SAMN05216488_0221 [Microbacterium sp. LKL04]
MPEDAEVSRAFVLMPFEADFDDVYTELIAAPLQEAGFEVSRADSLLNQRNILADVVAGIARADLVIADVTGLNPNVMYELGLAHALGKRTVMITREIGSLPFDLRPYRANEYSVNFARARALADLLRGIGEAVRSGTADFSNPVQDFAPGALEATPQVSVAPRASRDSSPGASSKQPDGDDDKDDRVSVDLGFLDGLELLGTSSERLFEVSNAIGARTGAVGDRFADGSARLEQIRKNLGKDRGLQPSLAVMRDMAKELDTYSKDLKPLNDELREALADSVAGANAVARFRLDAEGQDPSTLTGELESLSRLGEALISSYVSTSDFSTLLAGLPPMQSDLTVASRQAASVVAETASILEDAQAEFLRAESILRGRIEH